MLNSKSDAYSSVASCYREILEGVVVVLDPSIGSQSSQPGVAVYVAGVLVESGILPIPHAGSIPKRLQQLTHHLRKLYAQWDPDVLVYEEIPAQRYGGGNAGAHASLLKAVGASLSVSGPDHFVGVHPRSWKVMVSADYVKSDEGDAIEIGRIILAEAKRIGEAEVLRKEKKRASKKKEQ